ncbi:MAG TPA: VOC family protein [Armatimonadota bacterium]|nr:VOC family protein [Armatimonadota bacterium]
MSSLEPDSETVGEAATGVTLDHVNIVVTDMARSVAFYETFLGLRRGFEGVLKGGWIDTVTGLESVEARCVFMESGDLPVRLELLEYVNPVGAPISETRAPHLPGVRHIAFRVADLDAFCGRLQRGGIRLISGPTPVPFLLPGGIRKRLCYFYDPDGVLLEAAEYRRGCVGG